ncbi:MAG: xanthine dehydrogenase family protein subunit M [Thaumarchaeota archaeon]|nr:xanthine dehydrogenase family protein subunit M [Nitrososphaerota archaeon]
MSFGSPYVTLPDFTYHRPTTIEEVLKILKEHGDEAKVMGGGVGLLAFMKERLMSPSHVIDIKGVKELGGADYVPGRGLRIGASVTIAELCQNDLIQDKFTVLHEALSRVADQMIRGRATLVGNLCEAIPWVDSPPALISLDATVEVVGPGGRRKVPVASFIKGPVDIDLGPEEMVASVEVPDVSGMRSTFEKFTSGSEFSLASIAVTLQSQGRKRTARVVYGAVNSTPVRCQEVEQVLEQETSRASIRRAADTAADKVECMSDVLASSDYRKHLVKVVTTKALGRLLQK